LSTIEIESALLEHPGVGEAAAVGVTDPITGQAIATFVIPTNETHLIAGHEFAAELRTHVARIIGPIARPRDILMVPELPKTRSGKIMRRLLVDIASGRPLGDTTSLQDDTVPGRIAAIMAKDAQNRSNRL